MLVLGKMVRFFSMILQSARAHHDVRYDIYLINDDENILIEDEYLFGKLKETIEDKTVVMHDNCDCQPVYSIKIKDYSFSLHNHGILIKKSISKNVKHIEYIGFVECDSAIMEEMFDIIEEAN